MFGNQTLLCQMVLPVRSCAAAIRPDRARAWRAGSGPLRYSANSSLRCSTSSRKVARTSRSGRPSSDGMGLPSARAPSERPFLPPQKGLEEIELPSPSRYGARSNAVRCTEPEFASIVSAAIDLLSPRYRVSCFDACARHPGQQRSAFEVRNGRRRLGVGPKGRVAAIHLHSAYAAKPTPSSASRCTVISSSVIWARIWGGNSCY